MDYLTSLSPIAIRRGFAPGFVNYKKCVFNSQPQVIKFTIYIIHVLRGGMWTVLTMSNVLHKTSLKIPKGLSEAVNRRKKKDKRTNNDLQNITQKCNNQAM